MQTSRFLPLDASRKKGIIEDMETPSLRAALKEWAVAIRALREGRQVMLLRKGGILDAGGQFQVEAREVLLFPTYMHEEEQAGLLQPCYGAWVQEEARRRATTELNASPDSKPGEVVRIDAWARITDAVQVTNPDALHTLAMQHIYSEKFLNFRIENEPNKQLYALFLRAYDLPKSILVPMQPDYYGCRSYVTFDEPIATEGSTPCTSDHTYDERVRVTKRLLTGG